MKTSLSASVHVMQIIVEHPFPRQNNYKRKHWAVCGAVGPPVGAFVNRVCKETSKYKEGASSMKKLATIPRMYMPMDIVRYIHLTKGCIL